MEPSDVIVSQYRAALAMLRQAIERCPAALWDSPDDRNRFWHVAYHALFYTHLYLQDSLEAFTPWPRHRPEFEKLGPVPRTPQAQARIAEPYDRAALLEFLGFCQEQVTERVPRMALDGESGFHWLKFSKLEAQIYNIRHLQQHTGELMERLGARALVDVDWIGAR